MTGFGMKYLVTLYQLNILVFNTC